MAQITAAHHPERLARLVLTPCDAYERFLPGVLRPFQWLARIPGVLRGIDPRHALEAVERLKASGLPVLLAWARDDVFFPWREGQRLAADLPGAQLEPIEDARTFVSVDQPEAYRRADRSLRAGACRVDPRHVDKKGAACTSASERCCWSSSCWSSCCSHEHARAPPQRAGARGGVLARRLRGPGLRRR